jgi:Ras-related protein Rab-1A
MIFVFDIIDQISFDKLPKWIRGASQEVNPQCPTILIGNKSDLQSQRVVSRETAESFASSNQIPYIESSALNV